MMINKIIEKIEKVGVKKWKLVERNVKSKELFFVKKTLDMNRAKDVTKYLLTVYRDFKEAGKEYTGSSTIHLHPTMNDLEIEEKISNAFFAAKFVKNESYPLVNSVKKDSRKTSNAFEKINDVVKAIFVNDTEEVGAWINSVEVFLNVENTKVLNSSGLDIAFSRDGLEMEFITNAKNEREEIELYWNLKTSDLSSNTISSKVLEALKITSDRAIAQPTPKVKDIAIIFDEDGTKEILSYYVEKASVLNVYEHMSNAKIGEKLQGDLKGDGVTIYVDPTVKGSYFSQPFDDDGLEMRKVKIIDNGTLVSYWGNVRFSHYLKSKPTGKLTNFVVEASGKDLAKLREGKYIELKSFSDFQMNSLTGDFAGEIRLGWYYDGQKRIPITGGSVSGNVKDIQENFEFSDEVVLYGNYLGPKALKVHGAKIAGVK